MLRTARSYWNIDYYDTGAGGWIRDTHIPRAGISPFNKGKTTTSSYITLADGSEAKSTTESKSTTQTIELIFPQQIVTSSLRTQLSNYVDNDTGIRIIMPLSTGARLYTERILEGYLTDYQEEYYPGNKTVEMQIKVTLKEFNVDGS